MNFFTPLLIGGHPRSGTTFLANVLNSNKNIKIHGEITNKTIKSFINLNNTI